MAYPYNLLTVRDLCSSISNGAKNTYNWKYLQDTTCGDLKAILTIFENQLEAKSMFTRISRRAVTFVCDDHVPLEPVIQANLPFWSLLLSALFELDKHTTKSAVHDWIYTEFIVPLQRFLHKSKRTSEKDQGPPHKRRKKWPNERHSPLAIQKIEPHFQVEPSFSENSPVDTRAMCTISLCRMRYHGKPESEILQRTAQMELILSGIVQLCELEINNLCK